MCVWVCYAYAYECMCMGMCEYGCVCARTYCVCVYYRRYATSIGQVVGLRGLESSQFNCWDRRIRLASSSVTSPSPTRGVARIECKWRQKCRMMGSSGSRARARRAHIRGVLGHAPPETFWISDLLRSLLVQSGAGRNTRPYVRRTCCAMAWRGVLNYYAS